MCKSSCNIVVLSVVFYIFVLSAKIVTCEEIEIGKSFIKIVNSIGPKTLPCGIPDVTLYHSVHTPLPITLCFFPK